MDLRALLRGTSARSREYASPKGAFKLVAKVAFLVLLVAFAVAAAQSGSIILGLVIMAIASQFLYVIFPRDRVQRLGRYLWSGEAGEDAYETARSRTPSLGLGRWFD